MLVLLSTAALAGSVHAAMMPKCLRGAVLAMAVEINGNWGKEAQHAISLNCSDGGSRRRPHVDHHIGMVHRSGNVSQKVLWNKLGDHLSDSDKELLYSVFLEYADVFTLHPDEVGRTADIKHHIDTGDATPIHQLPRRIPQARRIEVRKMLEEMMAKDVIQPSIAPGLLQLY